MIENSRPRHINLDSLIILLLIVFAYALYRNFDPVEMLSADIHPWDSWYYRSISNQMLADGLSGLSEARPFCYRIIQPALVTIGRLASGATYSEASHAVNILSTVFVSLFCYRLWRKFGLPRCYAYAGILTLSISWQGPLRYSIYYPGGQFAFEIAVTCAVFFALKWIYSARKIKEYAIPGAVIFAATLARDNTLYQVIVVQMLLLSLRLLHKELAKNIHLRSIVAATISSVAGYFAIRILIKGEGPYNMFSTVLTFGWFHLNVGEDLYMFFYTYGPLFLFFLIALTFTSTRRRLLNALKDIPPDCVYVSAGLCISSIIFAFVGGTDSDRFLLWALPFFYFIGLASLNIIIVHTTKRKSVIAILTSAFVITSLWTRFYVPAVPHLLFTDNFGSAYYVKTNHNPDLFKGFLPLKFLRHNLVEVPASHAYDKVGLSGNINALPQAYVSEKLLNLEPVKKLAWTKTEIKGSYKYAINNIPFPLGFAHNQNELLAIHPYHGNKLLRGILLIQWLAIYLILVFLFRQSIFKAN